MSRKLHARMFWGSESKVLRKSQLLRLGLSLALDHTAPATTTSSRTSCTWANCISSSADVQQSADNTCFRKVRTGRPSWGTVVPIYHISARCHQCRRAATALCLCSNCNHPPTPATSIATRKNCQCNICVPYPRGSIATNKRPQEVLPDFFATDFDGKKKRTNLLPVQCLHALRQVVTHVQPQQKDKLQVIMQGRLHVGSLKSAGDGPIHSPMRSPIKTNQNKQKSKQTKQKTTKPNKSKTKIKQTKAVGTLPALRRGW